MPLFANHPSGHEPPATLTDAELEAFLVALRHKLRSARRSLLLAHAVGATLTVVILGAGFAVLSAGPAPFFERFLGHAHETTTFDAVAWWLVLLLLAIAGGSVLALGGMAVPITVLLLEWLGWRGTAYLSGILIMAIGLPLHPVAELRSGCGLARSSLGGVDMSSVPGGSPLSVSSGSGTMGSLVVQPTQKRTGATTRSRVGSVCMRGVYENRAPVV